VVGLFLLAGLSWWLMDASRPYWLHVLAWFLLGIFLHWLFCVPTTINRWLGLVVE